MFDKEAFRKGLQADLEAGRKAFEGRYSQELNALLGLSRTEIDAITPDQSDLVAYDALISLVKQASQHNLDQADLVSQIKGLGTTAVAIAKKTAALATLFA
jgi:hypothetical protein